MYFFFSVVFGQVVEGMDVVNRIGNAITDTSDRPFASVVISNCGELVLKRPLKKQKEKGESESESDSGEEKQKKKKKKKSKKEKKKRHDSPEESDDKQKDAQQETQSSSLPEENIEVAPPQPRIRPKPVIIGGKKFHGKGGIHFNQENSLLRLFLNFSFSSLYIHWIIALRENDLEAEVLEGSK